MKFKLFLPIILLLMLGIGVAEGATVQGYFEKTYPYANGTSNQIQLDCLNSVSNANVEFDVNSPVPFDNANGGTWKYYMSFPITTVPVDYAQYKIVINGTTWEIYNVTGGLEASGSNLNFWSLVKSDGSDIRVFDQNGNQLYFWIEKFDSVNQIAIIWVNVTAGCSELNVAYGNPSALPSSYNNGTKTFEFFDDFNDGVLDTTKWPYERGTWAESGGYAYVATDVGTAPGNWLRSSYYGSQYVVETSLILASDGPDTGLLIHAQGNATQYAAVGGPAAGTHDILFVNEWSGTAWGTATTTAFDYTAGERIHLRAIVNGTSVTIYDLTHGVTVSRTLANASGYVGLHQGAGFATSGKYDWIFVAKLADPADFGTPSVKSFKCVNATLLLNGNAVTYVGELNATNPSVTLSINSSYFVSGINYANFTADSGNFDAKLSFNYTLDIPQTETVSFDDMWVNLSTFTIPDGTQTSNTTVEFNTSQAVQLIGTPIYSYSLVVYVNGQQYSNYQVSDYEINGVKYITVSIFNVPPGSVDIAIHVVFKPSNITVYVYDELTKTEVKNIGTLNITLLDPNFNVLKSAQLNTSVSGNLTLQVVYSGYAYLRVRNANGVTRQIWIYVPLANNTTAYVYFPTSNVILIQFNIQDNTGLFKNGDIIIKKYIDREKLVEIDRQKITSDYVTYHYLIANEPYEIYVTNGQEVRNIGYLSSPVSKTTTITIGTLTIEPISKRLTYNLEYDSKNGTVTMEYSSPEPVKVVKFWINATNGTSLYYAESTEQSGSFVYVGQPNQTYLVHLYVETANGSEIHLTRIVTTEGIQPIKFPLFPANWPKWLYNLISVGIIVITILLFGEVRSDVACVLGAVMAALFWYWGWLRVNGIVVALAMIIAGAAVIYRSRRVGI